MLAARPGVERWILALVLGVAFLLRALQAQGAEPLVAGEAAFYVEWARAFAQGETLYAGPFLREPLYAWLLGGWMRIFGESLEVALWMHCVLGTVSTWLTYRIGLRVFGCDAKFTSLTAAAVVAVSGLVIQHHAVLDNGALTMTLVLLAIERSLSARTMAAAAVAGIVWGLCVLTEYKTVFLALSTLLCLASTLPRPERSRLCVLLLALVVPILATTAHNRLVAGQWVLVSTEAGFEFWNGNHANSDGHGAVTPWSRTSWWDAHYEALSFAETTTGLPRSESAVSRFYSGEAWRSISQNPGAAVMAMANKVRVLWSSRELPLDYVVRDRRIADSSWFSLPFFVIAGLGLVGMLFTVRKPGLLHLLVVVQTMVTAVFVVASEERMLLVPLLAPLAAHALLLVLQRARAKAWSAATLAGSAVVAVAASLHTQAPQVSDSQHGAKTMEAEASEAAVRELLLEVPSSIELRFALANALYAMGEYARARHEYERVVQAHPRNRRYLEALGLCCSELGDVPAAKRVFEAVKARR